MMDHIDLIREQADQIKRQAEIIKALRTQVGRLKAQYKAEHIYWSESEAEEKSLRISADAAKSFNASFRELAEKFNS